MENSVACSSESKYQEDSKVKYVVSKAIETSMGWRGFVSKDKQDSGEGLGRVLAKGIHPLTKLFLSPRGQNSHTGQNINTEKNTCFVATETSSSPFPS